MNHQKIIAVDFDGCIVEDNFPDIGNSIRETLDALLAEQEQGAKIILWTCRRGAQLDDATDWCKAHGIKLDAVNENLPEMVELYGEDARKIFASEYWDDRARKMPISRCRHFLFPNVCKAGCVVRCAHQRRVAGWFVCAKGEVSP
jgi:hypothetical protein